MLFLPGRLHPHTLRHASHFPPHGAASPLPVAWIAPPSLHPASAGLADSCRRAALPLRRVVRRGPNHGFADTLLSLCKDVALCDQLLGARGTYRFAKAAAWLPRAGF